LAREIAEKFKGIKGNKENLVFFMLKKSVDKDLAIKLAKEEEDAALARKLMIELQDEELVKEMMQKEKKLEVFIIFKLKITLQGIEKR
jgi:hypothetical protein